MWVLMVTFSFSALTLVVMTCATMTTTSAGENDSSTASSMEVTRLQASLPTTMVDKDRYTQTTPPVDSTYATTAGSGELPYYPINNVTLYDDRLFWRQVADAYFEYCKYSCKVRNQTNRRHNMQCLTCFCDDACFAYGDCCPDLYATAGHGPSEDLISSRIHCSPTTFGQTALQLEYSMVTKCPENASVDLCTVDKCEDFNYQHWECFQPVTDVNTLLTYRNRYCAQCNSAGNVTRWEIRIAFRNITSVSLFGKLPEEIYRAAIVDNAVEVIFSPTIELVPYTRYCFTKATSQCNATGDWANYDVLVEKACQSFTAVSFFSYSVYKNPFCTLCNYRYTWTYLLNSSSPAQPALSLKADYSLQILVDFHNDDDDGGNHDPACGPGQFFDTYTSRCRQVVCAPGKKLVQSGGKMACKSQPKVSNVYGYRICLHANMDLQQSNLFIQAFAEFFSYTSLTPLSLEMFEFSPNFSDVTDLRTYMFVLKLFSEFVVDRDLMDVSMLENVTAILEAVNDSLKVSEGLALNSTVKISATCIPEILGVHLQINYTNITVHKVAEYVARGELRERYYWAEYLPLTALLTCAGVELNSSEFLIYVDRRKLLILCSEQTVDFPYFNLIQNGAALVCLEHYMGQSVSMGIHQVLYVVALICIIISLVFLLVSFIVYSLLPELRSVAGINNMVLIVALFWAQICVQVAADADLPDWLCQALGVMTHWLWLCVVFAQNACTFHVFYTLSFPLRSHAANTNVRVMATRYVTYVLTTASIVVITVVVWHIILEDNIGYGGENCFLRKAVARITTFAVPLVVTVLLNLSMFVITIVCLRRHPPISSTRSNKINLLLYTKLSVFTGVTWVFGFLASILGSLAMQYVFAVMQGCQGLFVFLAFLANKRVMSMLKEWRMRKKATSTTSHEHDHCHHHTDDSQKHNDASNRHTASTNVVSAFATWDRSPMLIHAKQNNINSRVPAASITVYSTGRSMCKGVNKKDPDQPSF